MSITNYGTLHSAIVDYLDNPQAADHISYFVQKAEHRMNRMRVRHMESAMESTIASGVIAVPSDYLEMKHAYVDGTPARPLEVVDINTLYAVHPNRAASGKPALMAQNVTNFEFGPYPSSNYTIKGTYYAKPAALSEDSDTNWAITHYPMWFLYCCLAESAPFYRDAEALQMWTMHAKEMEADIKKEESRSRISGSPLRQRRA